MPILSILLFIAVFIFIVLVGIYIFLILYNHRSRSAIDKFIEQVTELRPIIFQNIKVRYSETSGLKTYFYPNNRCDLYLFNDHLAIVREQNFIFRVFFAPVLLTSDIAKIKSMFDYLHIYKPDRITFSQIIPGEIDIKLTDPTHQHYTIRIIVKGLTIEQINQLEIIKNWC